MADEDAWNNPFASLDKGNYPDPERQPENRDGELFLEALRNLRASDKDSAGKSRGFSLRERGVPLDGMKVGKKGKSKKAARENAAEQKRDCPTAQEAKKSLSPDESDAFLLAMADATPLKPGGRMVSPAWKKGGQRPREAAFEEMLEETLEFALLNGDEYVEGHVTGLDEGTINRLRAGSFGPEAHLDLHGLNSFQAFEAVRDFIRMSWFKGLRSILIVPGRGLNSPDGRGVLRRKLQEWLPHEPFRRVVLAFCTAQPRDGGPGSIYVLLRSRHKKGRIHWDSLPPDPDLYF